MNNTDNIIIKRRNKIIKHYKTKYKIQSIISFIMILTIILSINKNINHKQEIAEYERAIISQKEIIQETKIAYSETRKKAENLEKENGELKKLIENYIEEKDPQLVKTSRGTPRDIAGISRGTEINRVKDTTELKNKLANIQNYEEVLFEVTMYTNAEGAFPKGGPNYGLTASGVFTDIGSVAAPKSIPFGSQIILKETKEGYENLLETDLIVHDRGGKIVEKTVNGQKVYCIDIYNPNLKDALNWGRQLIKGYIVKPK